MPTLKRYRNDGYGNIDIRGVLIVTSSSQAFKISALSGKFDAPYDFPVAYAFPALESGVTQISIDNVGGFTSYDSNTFNEYIQFNNKILV